MRFMIIIRANADTEAGVMPEESLLAAMTDFHEELAKAGVLLDASGLKPSSHGWRIQYRGGKRTVIDGPFAETKELIAGYTLIEVRSREEAMQWAARYPAPMGEHADGEIEVRELYDLEDFEHSDAIDRFRRIETAGR